MLTIAIYVIGSIRRALKKTGRGMSMVAEAFEEAIEQTDAARRKYPFAD